MISSSLPVAFAGSSNGQCSLRQAARTTGQCSTAGMAKTL